MKKTSAVLVMLMLCAFSVFAVTEQKADDMCEQATFSCAVLPRDTGASYDNVYSLVLKYDGTYMTTEAVTSWTIVLIKNADDFEKTINANLLTRNIKFVQKGNKFIAYIDGKSNVNDRYEILDMVTNPTYLAFAKKMKASTIRQPRFDDVLAIQEYNRNKWEQEHYNNPKPRQCEKTDVSEPFGGFYLKPTCHDEYT